MFASLDVSSKADVNSYADMKDARALFILQRKSASPTSSASPTISGEPTLSPTISPLPSVHPSELPSAQPTGEPSAVPTVVPPQQQSRVHELKRRTPSFVRWALLIPIFSIGFIVWAVREQPQRRRIVSCINPLFQKPVPDEIRVPGKGKDLEDVELVNASTWKTLETWEEADEDGHVNAVSLVSSSETSDLSTDFVVMK